LYKIDNKTKAILDISKQKKHITNFNLTK